MHRERGAQGGGVYRERGAQAVAYIGNNVSRAQVVTNSD